VPSVTVEILVHFLERRDLRVGAAFFKGAGSAGFTALTGSGVGAGAGFGAGASGAFPLIRSPNLDIFNT